MSSFSLAWRSFTRQPARAVLGIAGIAIVGALLFDMLLLSRGLVVSFRDLLEGVGFDIRVTANQWVPSRSAMIRNGPERLGRLRGLPEVEAVADRVKASPALHSVCLSNEPIYVDSRKDKTTQRMWLAYLKRRHQTIERLNERYGSGYPSLPSPPLSPPCFAHLL